MNKNEAVTALRTAHLQYLRRTSTMPDEELQSIAKNHSWSDRTANGLTRMIVAFFDYNGHCGNRINTMGTPIVKEMQKYDVVSGKLETTKRIAGYKRSTTKKGTTDAEGIINGRAAKIEVKIGKDKMSPAQIKLKEKIEAAGGLYYIAKDFIGFYNWYLSITTSNEAV